MPSFGVLPIIEKKCITLVGSWDTITSPISLGGLGLHKAADKNTTQLTCLTCRILSHPHSIWAKVFADKYKPNTSKSSHLFIWKNILKGNRICS
uniref:Putative ovule protein n=1 Tax=Solanum chacoense TaxID=4108 RepID=A0A0V0GMX8_SOLCH